VRELRNVAERAVLVARGPVLLPEHLPLEPAGGRAPSPPAADAEPGYPPTLPLAEVERRHIAAVLRAVGGHMGRAAETLGLHRNTLTRKVREFGLDGDAR
jgi:Nif-specific regulatory protein